MKKENKVEEMKTYLIEHDNGEERKITVPANWKVTFGPAASGSYKSDTTGRYKMPLALRFYEGKDKQRAIFTDVKSFRDLSIKVEIRKISVQEKQGYMECDGERKATTFRAEVATWVNPDEVVIKKLPSPSKVKDFDVSFNEIKPVEED